MKDQIEKAELIKADLTSLFRILKTFQLVAGAF